MRAHQQPEGIDMRANVLLTNNEAAHELGVHPVTLANWRVKRRGPPYTKLPGGRVVYDRDELWSWRSLASCYVKHEATDQS
jgi:hypothetical protein